MKISKFTAAIIASSIALTSLAAIPASAARDGEKLTRLLLGAIAVGAIVDTVKKNKRKRNHAAKYDNYNSHQPARVRNSHRPKTCLRKKYTNQGWKTFYSQKCLNRHRAERRDHHPRARHHKHHNSHAHGQQHNNNRYNNPVVYSNRRY